MNWWNEIFIEEGWYDFDKEEETLERGKLEERIGHFCRVCGSRTGLHGFSFDQRAW